MSTGVLVLSIALIACSVILVAVILFQSGRDASMSSAVTGSSASNFYNKNKGATKEVILKRFTVVISIIFIVAIIVSNLIQLL